MFCNSSRDIKIHRVIRVALALSATFMSLFDGPIHKERSILILELHLVMLLVLHNVRQYIMITLPVFVY